MLMSDPLFEARELGRGLSLPPARRRGAYDVVIGRDAIVTKSATTSSSGRLASSSCVQLARSSGSTLARSSKIIARSTGVFP